MAANNPNNMVLAMHNVPDRIVVSKIESCIDNLSLKNFCEFTIIPESAVMAAYLQSIQPPQACSP